MILAALQVTCVNECEQGICICRQAMEDELKSARSNAQSEGDLYSQEKPRERLR